MIPAQDPARPGPGTLPTALLRALQIDVGRRIEGMLAGEYRSSRHGDGVELAQVRPYVPGDDVRALAKDALRHRLVLSYQALAESVDADAILDRVLAAVPVPEVSPVRPAAA